MKILKEHFHNNEKITVCIPETEADFEKYFYLRWLELRSPWNQPLGAEKDNDENTSMHFAIVNSNDECIGVCRLQTNSAVEAQVRYMAVRKDYQKQHLGDLLLNVAEEKAKASGVDYVILHARDKAISFYERNGYNILEKSYLMFNEIQHFLMRKNL